MREELELKSLRPEKFSEQIAWNEIEAFQNEVLRPILKYQNDLILSLTNKEPLFQKQISHVLTIDQKSDCIKRFFLLQPNYKHFLIGQICGLLTTSEFDFYLQSKKDIDKRISNMLLDRILSHYC
ncbi:MAG: hypothetical protein ACKO7P_09215 [Bacteroidota bacterium]